MGVDEKHPLNSTGGAATHTITQQELPPHVHDLFARANGDTDMDRADFIMNQWAYRGQYLQNGKWHPRLAHTLQGNYAGSIEYPNNPIGVEQLKPYASKYTPIRTGPRSEVCRSTHRSRPAWTRTNHPFLGPFELFAYH